MLVQLASSAPYKNPKIKPMEFNINSDLLKPISLKAPDSLFSVIKHTVLPQHLGPSLNDEQQTPIPTNKFYDNFVLDNGRQPVWPLPYGLRWENGQTNGILGLSISQADASTRTFGPDPAADPARFFFNPFIPSLSISASEFGVNHTMTVSNFDEFSVELNLFPAALDQKFERSAHISIPIVRGMSYVTANYENLTPIFGSVVLFRNIELVTEEIPKLVSNGWQKYRILLENGVVWLLYAKPSNDKSKPLDLKLRSPNLLGSDSGLFTGIVQIAKIPFGSSQTEALYDRNVGTYATGATLQVSNSDGNGIYAFKWNVVRGNESQPLLHFALPHHSESFSPTSNVNPTEIQLPSITNGMMTAYLGDNWVFVEKELNKVDFLPTYSHITAEQKATIAQQAKLDVASDFKAQTLDLKSIYFSGKGLAKLGMVCLVANDFLDDKALGKECLDKLKAAMEPLVSNNITFPLQYDSTWKGIISSEGFTNGPTADFGNTWYNDHHYHYGYHIHAAAIIRHYDEVWGKNHEEWVNSLIRDVANPSSEDKYFPTFRAFDWFMGHSWSTGIFSSADGKDEESTSEDVNFYYAMKLWGLVSRQADMVKLSDLMLGILARSLDSYFLMKNDNKVQPKNFVKNKVTGILFENKIDYTTYFSNKTECIHGIQILPVTPISPYSRSSVFVREEWETVLAPIVNNITDGWMSLLQMNYAQINPTAAYDYFLKNPKGPLDDGLTRTWALFWTAAQKL
ncbi:hypothetical protein G9A89_010054 [Geosiphon pyriformis]|nr:hypothetical protein G9A89_010054 [Geosiphon pyriformis]